MSTKWTKEELRLLKKLYPNTITVDIAEKLGKPLYVVAYQARKLGLKKAEGHFKWTDKQIAYLKKAFPDHRLTIEEIADHLGKGIKAVRTKANQIGLRRSPRRK
jgi:hypothetical protein